MDWCDNMIIPELAVRGNPSSEMVDANDCITICPKIVRIFGIATRGILSSSLLSIFRDRADMKLENDSVDRELKKSACCVGFPAARFARIAMRNWRYLRTR